jgi:rhodanese-related sulfurtransferase
MAQIRAEELKEKMDRGEDLAILDVRHPVEFHADPRVIPGAVFTPLEELKEEDYARLRDKEVIVYCG